MRISISTKLISVTILILLASTGSITYISSTYFERRTSEQVDIANLESATAKAKEVENIITNFIEQLKVSSGILMTGITRNPDALVSFENNFKSDRNIFSLEIFEVKGSGLVSVAKRVRQDHLNTYKITERYIENIRQWQKFPISSVIQGSVEIKNASFKNGPPLFTIGIPLIRNEQGQITHITIADFHLAALQKPFLDKTERTHFLVDREGILLGHTNEEWAMARYDMNKNPLVQKSKTQKSPQYQTKFTDPTDQKTYFGASVQTAVGVTLISQTSEAVILEVSNEVKRRAIFVAGTAVSIAIFAIFLFSMTLTSPIEKLADLIKVVAKGNFDVSARSAVKSHDEVGDLATAFDQMTEGLKERDKVKSLFSKFHGSSVTEDLINKDIGLGGQDKEVVVFFSDIRGFTAFSEKRSPEEVVAMLNEYFAVMVAIINRNGGVVDKFIGDAIMAIWGAPKSSDKDACNAVKACLEMRKALEGLNATRESRGEPPIAIGMGLHAGRAISGTIGSDERMEFTVIGNTVNTASRIEASTKAFGTDLLITDDVLSKVGEKYIIDYAGAAEVKGRSEALKMYKVKGYKTESGEEVIIQTQWSEYEAEKADKVKIAS